MASPPLSLRGIYESLRAPTLRDVVFSAKAYLAVVLSLVVGFSQNLENPYWAALTVYLVLTPPESGAIRSNALFRFLGTLAGGLLMMAVTALFGDQLGILAAATIMIITVATYLRQTSRTQINVLWFSAGTTAGVVGLANLLQPANVFDYATARSLEISLGIAVITAVDSILWPRPITNDFLQTMADWSKQARRWMADAAGLAGDSGDGHTRPRALRQGLRDLTRAMATIDARAIQLPFDIISIAPQRQQLNLVRRQVVNVIADLIAVVIWTRSLASGEDQHGEPDPWVRTVARWLEETGDGDAARARASTADALITDLDTARTSLDPVAHRSALVRYGLLTRLIALVRDWSDLNEALWSVATGSKLPSRLLEVARHSAPVRSVDYVRALADVAPMILSMTFTASLWYWTAWGSGSGALLFSFIGCVFLMGQDRILQSSVGLIVVILTAFGSVFLYQYAILPRVTEFPVLVMVVGCAVLPFGLLMTMSTAGMLLCIYTFSFLGLQNAYSADFNQSLQTLSSSIVGLFIALASLYVCSFDHARFNARRLVAAVRHDIADIAGSRRRPLRQRFLFLATDRLSLYFPAAEQSAGGGQIPRLRMLEDFGIGANLLTLREHERSATLLTRDTIRTVCDAAARAYLRKLADLPDDGLLRDAVEAALDAIAADGAPDSLPLLDALTGIRLALASGQAQLPEDAER